MKPSGPRPNMGAFATIGSLLPFLWPQGEWSIKARVVLAVVFLIASKIAVVWVPIFYKDAVDALTGETEPLLAIPVAIILGYGLMRVASLAFGEMRDAIFARVGAR